MGAIHKPPLNCGEFPIINLPGRIVTGSKKLPSAIAEKHDPDQPISAGMPSRFSLFQSSHPLVGDRRKLLSLWVSSDKLVDICRCLHRCLEVGGSANG